MEGIMLWRQLTVGVEMEFPNAFSTGRDSPVPTRWDGSIITKLRNFYGDELDAGMEFASYPRDTISGIRGDIESTYSFAANAGGVINERGSFHVHVQIPRPLRRVRFVKYLLEHFYLNDDHLLRLGGLGGVNRGIYNDFSYCRPLRSTPVVYHRASSDLIHVFDVPISIKSKFRSFDSFTAFMFDTYTRYNAARYTTVNFHSLTIYGTIEFRVFNMPVTPKQAVEIVMFCRLYIYALTKAFLDDRQDVFRRRMEFHEIVSAIDRFSDKKPFSKSLYSILDLYERSEPIDMERASRPTLYHRIIQNYSTAVHYHDRLNKVKVVDSSKVVRPNLTDYRSHSHHATIKLQ